MRSGRAFVRVESTADAATGGFALTGYALTLVGSAARSLANAAKGAF
jgi:hypothetical protein